MRTLKYIISVSLIGIFLTTSAIFGGYFLYLGINNIDKTITKIQQLTTKPSFEELKSITVRIIQRVDEGGFIGTGTIIEITDTATYILTNEHVAPLSNAERIYVVDEFKKEHKATVLANSPFVDLSLIKIEGRLPNKTKFKGLGFAKESDRLYSVGMYLGNYYIYTEGTFGGYDNNGNALLNVPGSGGCSGSGVFNAKGELVSVIFAGNVIGFFQVETARLLAINRFEVENFLFRTKEFIK